MFDSETRHFIRCDTCPELYVMRSPMMSTKDKAAGQARAEGWEIHDGLHRCSDCIERGRTERAS